ncbi:MAG: cation-efflux pump [Actinomycetota bacterium]
MITAISTDRKQAQRVAAISLVAAIGLVVAKLVVGLASGSLAILSEAAHSALDAGATALTFAAVRIASRPPDEEHPYGHGKAENISALVETIGLFALSIYIAVQAVGRLRTGAEEVDAAWYTFAVIGLSIVVDANRSWILHRVGRKFRSPALQADALHFTADLLTSAVVLIGLIFVALGYPSADAIGSLFIAAYVAYSSISLGRKSVDVLMDRAPTAVVERITEAALAVEGVEEVRRVRARFVGGHPQTDIVIGISRRLPLERARAVTDEVEKVVGELEPGADVVVQLEPIADEELIVEQVEAIAARHASVGQVHNIFVTASPEGLLVTLHAKFPGSMSLAEAHDICENLEAEIAAEVPGCTRVDTHMEPLGEGAVGKDVTIDQKELAAWASLLAEQQSEVENCHEVLITQSDGALQIVMHCEAASGLSVEAVHDAATRIEDEIHRRWPEVARVTVHFEPAEVPTSKS